MPSDYDWSLPSIDSGGWTDTGNYSLEDSGGSAFDSGDYSLGDSGFDFRDDDWYVDSTSGDIDTSMFDDIWGWVKSPQGTSVLGGAADILTKLWMANQANELRKSNESGPSAAELYDARVKAHNASINKPMDMGLIKYER